MKEIEYNSSSCIIYIRPLKISYLVKITCDRDILGNVHQLKYGDIVKLYMTHLLEKIIIVPLAIEYDPKVGGESYSTFDNEFS